MMRFPADSTGPIAMTSDLADAGNSLCISTGGAFRFARSAIGVFRESGEKVVKNRRLVGEEGFFDCYLFALWDSEGVVVQDVECTSAHEVHVLRVGAPPIVFRGIAAADLLSIVSPLAGGGAEGRQQILDWKLTRESLRLRISLPTLVREGVGGSKAKSSLRWQEAIERGEVSLLTRKAKFEHAFRNRRHWSSLFQLHAYGALCGRVHPEFGTLSVVVLTAVESLLMYGRWDNAICGSLKSGIDGVINLENQGVSSALRGVGVAELAAIYKSRKLYIKDDVDVLRGAVAVLDRFKLPATPLSMKAESALQHFCDRYSNYLAGASADRLASWKRGEIDHQGGAGVYTTKAAGGRAAECHLIVGLYRLYLGQPSTLAEVFGAIDSQSLDSLVAQVESVDAHKDEILAACLWFIKQSRDWPRCAYAIFPQREPKMRAFLMISFAEQFVGRLLSEPLRCMLKDDPFCRAAFAGNRTQGSPFDEPLREAVEKGDWVLLADAKAATDNIQFETSKRILSVARDYVPAGVYEACEVLLSPSWMSATTERPQPCLIAGLRRAVPTLLTPGRLPLVGGTTVRRSSPLVVPREIRGEPLLQPANVPAVRLLEHVDAICDSIRCYQLTLVKASTGSGKTVLLSTLTDSIVQMPSIASILLFKESLRSMGKACTVFYALDREEPRVGVPILCTAALVASLARRFPSRLVVLDEVESMQEDCMLNLRDCVTWGNRVVATSATPDKLRIPHDFRRLDFDTPSPYLTTTSEMREVDLKVRLKEGKFSKALVVVHSEPYARRLAEEIPGAIALLAADRASDYASKVIAAKCIVSTNVVRSSVTIPGLDLVADYGVKYVELDFASQGFSSLCVVKVTQEERTQLRGRVGRTGPGEYVTVKHDVEFHELDSGMHFGRMPKVARRFLDGMSLATLAQPVCQATVLMDGVTHQLVELLWGVKATPLTPLSVSFGRRLGDKGRALVLLATLEESGLFSRAMGLSSSTDPVEVDAYNSVKELRSSKPGAYLTALESVYRSLCKVQAYGIQTRLIQRWMSTTTDEAGELLDGQPLPEGRFSSIANDDALRAYMLSFGWRSIARSEGNNYVGVFRDFKVSKSGSDPPLACLMGLGTNRGDFRFAVAFALSEEDLLVTLGGLSRVRLPVEVSPMDEIGVEEFDPFHPWDPAGTMSAGEDGVSEETLFSLAGLVISRYAADVKGRGKMRLRVEEHVFPKRQTSLPSDLPDILDAMRSHCENACKVPAQLTCRGMPMSWIVSFAVLNAVNSAAYYEAKRRAPVSDLRNRANGFGDDLIASGTEAFVREVNEIREDLGLAANEHATGYFHHSLLKDDDESAIGVFCEVLYDLRKGGLLHPPKTRAYLSLANAYAPEEFIHGSQAYLPDVAGVERFMSRHTPEYLEVLRTESPSLDRPFRTTYPRALLRRVFQESLGPFEPVLSPHDARELLSRVEPFILPVAPSTRGAPERMLETFVSRPPIIGVVAAKRLAPFVGLKEGSFRVMDIEEFVGETRRGPHAGVPFILPGEWGSLGMSRAYMEKRSASNMPGIVPEAEPL